MAYTFNPLTGNFDYYIAGGTGPTGNTGPAGAMMLSQDGEDGLDGWFGPQGNQGIQGVQGVAGAIGIAGPMGFAIDGEEGLDGHSIIGPQGIQGIAGVNGTSGINGVSGVDGIDGEEGSIWLISSPSSGGAGVPATTVVSETTAGQSPAVGTSTNYAREDHTHGTPAAGAGSGSVITTTEVNLGTLPISNGSFQITGSGFVVGKPVVIQQAALTYTGKGTYTDEIEMDQVNVGGYVLNATTINCNWGCWTRVFGNMKFNYLVSA